MTLKSVPLLFLGSQINQGIGIKNSFIIHSKFDQGLSPLDQRVFVFRVEFQMLSIKFYLLENVFLAKLCQLVPTFLHGPLKELRAKVFLVWIWYGIFVKLTNDIDRRLRIRGLSTGKMNHLSQQRSALGVELKNQLLLTAILVLLNNQIGELLK